MAEVLIILGMSSAVLSNALLIEVATFQSRGCIHWYRKPTVHCKSMGRVFHFYRLSRSIKFDSAGTKTKAKLKQYSDIYIVSTL